MTTAEPHDVPAAPPPADPAAPEDHGEDAVHHYSTADINEGNKRVPRWLMVVLTALLVFWVVYIVVNWHAQPSTAHFK